MKRKITVLLLSLLLLPALCGPALAVIEYGVFYDETEQLGSVELTYQGEQTLPQLTEALGIDLRVDVFTDEGVEDSSVSDIAVYVYENSGYGCGEKRDGVSLTLLLRGSVKGYDTCTRLTGSTDLARGKVHYALMPVWMLNTKWQGKDFLFAMNGQTGKLVGDLPVSWGKFWGMFAGIAALLSIVGSIGVTLLML